MDRFSEPSSSSFVSATFSSEVAAAHFEGGSTTWTAVQWRQTVPVTRLLMTFLETREMSCRFREAEVVLIGDPANRALKSATGADHFGGQGPAPAPRALSQPQRNHLRAGRRDLTLLVARRRLRERDPVECSTSRTRSRCRARSLGDRLSLREDRARGRDVSDLLGHVLHLARLLALEQLEVHEAAGRRTSSARSRGS